MLWNGHSTRPTKPLKHTLPINVKDSVYCTGPLVCLSLFSIMFWIRVSASIWNLSLANLVSQNKETDSQRRVKQFISFDDNDV